MTEETTSRVVGDEGSVLDSLRRQHAAISIKKTHEFRIPGYSDLYVRVHPITFQQTVNIRKLVERFDEDERELQIAARVLVDASECLLIQTPDGTKRPLTRKDIGLEDKTGEPVGFWPIVAKAFGHEVDTAADSVFAIFNNDMALHATWLSYMTWQTEVQMDVEEEVKEEFTEGN